MFLDREEQSTFEHQFYTQADEILDNAEKLVSSKFNELMTLSTTITSYALDTGSTWPNVTLPHFTQRSQSIIQLAGMEMVIFTPIVSLENKAGFEAYAREHQDWIAKDLVYTDDPNRNVGSISPEIQRLPFHQDSEYFSDLVYLPAWQYGPSVKNASLVNKDLIGDVTFARVMDDSIESNHLLLSEVIDTSFYRLHIDDGEHDEQEDPRSVVFQPVWDTFDQSGNIVGFLVGIFTWDNFFENSLSEDIRGFTVNVRSTCGTGFTYVVNGRDSVFLGEGDVSHIVMYRSCQSHQKRRLILISHLCVPSRSIAPR